MRILAIGIMLGLSVSCASTSQTSTPLFTYNGKDFYRDDLPDANRHRLFNAQVKYYRDALAIIRESVIDIYLTERAQQQGKTLSEVKGEVFSSTEPTEEEKKKFYEEIKSKLPYSYEIIKHELGSLIVEKRVQEQEQALIKEIEEAKGVELFLTAPIAPRVDLAVDDYPTKGATDAKVRIVEFGDFSCPNCRLAMEVVDKLLEKYGSNVTFTWRYFFLHSGGASVRLAKGGHCAHKQGKFWEYYDYVFANQSKLRWKAPTSFVEDVDGIETSSFESCYNDPATEEFVSRSHNEGSTLGVEQTPTFFVNGKRIVLGAGFQGLEAAVKEAL